MTDYTNVSLSSGKLHLFDGSTTDKTIIQSGNISGDVTITLPTTNSATLADLATVQTLTNKSIDFDNNTITNIEVDNFKAATLVTSAEGIGSNDNNTTIPTSAAVKSYADSLNGVSLSGSTNNTICTVTGSNAIIGESTFTYDGTTVSNAAATITSSGTDDKALDLSITLNDTSAAGGSDTFRLVKGSITATDLTGWNDVYLIDLLTGGSSKFNVTSAGAVTAASTITAATGSTIGNLTLANGSITDSSGTITFGNENLTTSGTLSSGVLNAEDIINVGGGSGVGIVKFLDSDGSHSINLSAPTVVGTTITFTLPTADGSADQVLKTNGSGALSFVSQSGGGGASVLSGLTDVTKDATNFVNSFLIQPNSDGSAPSTGTLSSANNNLGIGNSVFSALTSGALNVCFGHNAGSTLSEGANNTSLGALSVLSALVDNQTAIGYEATCNAANQITLGNSSVTALRCADTTIASLSDSRDKTNVNDSSYGLSFVNTLRPVQFTWDRRNLVAGDDTSVYNGKSRVGFIAQELQSAMPNNENDVLDLVYDVNPERIEAKYGNLIPILTKAIQDLSATNDALTTRVAALESA
jgi:trimeric autotransporter adhesin